MMAGRVVSRATVWLTDPNNMPRSRLRRRLLLTTTGPASSAQSSGAAPMECSDPSMAATIVASRATSLIWSSCFALRLHCCPFNTPVDPGVAHSRPPTQAWDASSSGIGSTHDRALRPWDNAGMETRRLILRSWRETDNPPFAALNADPEVMLHFPGVLTHVESDALADRMASQIAVQGWGFWAVEVAATRRFIGYTGLGRPSFDAPFGAAIEVGWRLSRYAWGCGYATEAARAAVAYGFTVLALDEIVSFTVPANVRSRAVMERLGMTHNPADAFDHPLIAREHPLRRHVLYRLPATRREIGMES